MQMSKERLSRIFEKRYEFRLAHREDIPAIMRYIDEAWRKGHILSTDRELFEYEFCDGDEVHFLLAIDRETGEIEGLDGYYYTSARRAYRDFDVWGSMWSVRQDHHNLPMLGIQIANEYYRQVGFRYEIGVGVNTETATPLQRDHFGVVTGVMDHYYMLNPKLGQEEFRIAVVRGIPEDTHTPSEDILGLIRAGSIEEVAAAFDFDTQITMAPYKDAWYVDHRFFRHPVYRYDVYLLGERTHAEAVMVMRRVEHDGHHVLRIVDYMGDMAALKDATDSLRGLMDAECEYIDFYNYGYERDQIGAAGFTLRTAEDVNIIPNYFEPFVQANVDCWFNSDARDNFVICKADADQDRPNIRQKERRA